MAYQPLNTESVLKLKLRIAEVGVAERNHYAALMKMLPIGTLVRFSKLRRMTNFEGRIYRIYYHNGQAEIWMENLKTGNAQKFYVYEFLEADERGELTIEEANHGKA